tara:strand:- start:3525 stop:3677 length:153 start_codon:yes stop_codon:yes gene_type:complete
MNYENLRKRIMSIENRLFKLEQEAHPPREFVVCNSCKAKIKEKDGTEEKT